MKRLLCLAAAVIFTAGCQSSAPMVVATKHTLQPARTSALAGSKALQIVAVEGGNNLIDNKVLNSRLSALLAAIEVEGNKRFDLVTQKADTLISADFDINVKTQSNSSISPPCQPTIGEDGTLGGCSNRESASCLTRTIELELVAKVTGAKDGSVLMEKPYKASHSVKSCGGSRQKRLLPEKELAELALTMVLRNFAADIAPSYISLNIPFIRKDDANLSDDKVKLFEDAMAIAAQGMLSQACQQLFLSAGYLFDSPAIMYNVGVCWEVQGNAEAALGYYEKAFELADKLSSKDKALVESAIKRL